MSVDICFWKCGSGSPQELYESAADGEIGQFESSVTVVDFRECLISRWPEIEDSMEPPSFDPDLEEQEDLSCAVAHLLPNKEGIPGSRDCLPSDIKGCPPSCKGRAPAL